MIVEQAFIGLPELLLGNYYPTQDYEAGIVGVFSMALLQELNGRNVSHPIQHLKAEHRYNPNSSRRADLYVDLKRLLVANRSLENYGWRHHNWIEAKFYRNNSSKSTYQGQLIADIIRLTCLVPLTPGRLDSNGRYFLHVYDDEPKHYLVYRNRPWVEKLHMAGQREIIINELHKESDTAKKQFGETLEDVVIQATVTNFVNFPIEITESQKHYWCVLTRFDAFSVTVQEQSFYIHFNRDASEGNTGDYKSIAETIGNRLGSTKESERQAIESGDLD